MGSVNYSTPKDTTVKIFDSFYNYELEVDAATYDVVYSFFLTRFDDTVSAKNFTYSMFQVANNSNLNIIDLIEDMRSQNNLTITSTIAFYLNNLRSNSTLLGVGQVNLPNITAARNVLL
jgi:hypothetical protein